jgi:hypothetical protein
VICGEKRISKSLSRVQHIISVHGSDGDALAPDYRANIELIAKAAGVQHFVLTPCWELTEVTKMHQCLRQSGLWKDTCKPVV